MCLLVFLSLSHGVSGQVWNLFVSIPEFCLIYLLLKLLASFIKRFLLYSIINSIVGEFYPVLKLLYLPLARQACLNFFFSRKK